MTEFLRRGVAKAVTKSTQRNFETHTFQNYAQMDNITMNLDMLILYYVCILLMRGGDLL